MKRNTLIALRMVLDTALIIIVLCVVTSTPLPAVSAFLSALFALALSLVRNHA
jgi:hypothetical protein